MDNFYSIKDAVCNYIKACVGKVTSSNGKIFGKAILAGAMIAMGAAGSNVAAHSIDNVGVSRVAAGVIFPMGLMMVILMGAELFTGDCMLCMGKADKQYSFLDMLRVLVVVYLGNFVGALFIAACVNLCGQLNYSGNLLGAYTIKVALGKCNVTFVQGLTSGILCNILICAAVIMAGCAKDITGKLLCSFFIILLFVTSGFEHCVANMYYIPAGLIAKLNPQYVQAAMEQYSLTAEKIATLDISHFMVTNLVPVTIGNIIGGLLVGLSLYYLNVKSGNRKN